MPLDPMQLDPKAVLYFMIQKVLLGLVLSFWACIFLFARAHPNGQPAQPPGVHAAVLIPLLVLAALAFLLFTIVNWVVSLLRVQAYRIALRKEGIALDYGVVTKNHELLLFDKIQDILITRNLIERILGLSTLVIQNAMGKAERIPGLAERNAESLREMVLSHVTH
jgi:uncharacterized membrane protein YdbT with pleckstrin-like domain